MIHSHVNSFTSGFGCEAANDVGMIKTSLIGELSLLRDDGCCSSDRCDRLERAWGGWNGWHARCPPKWGDWR